MKNILFLIVFPLFAFLYCQGQAIEVIALSERAVKKNHQKKFVHQHLKKKKNL